MKTSSTSSTSSTSWRCGAILLLLLLWGCSAVLCLVNEDVRVLQVTTPGHYTPGTVPNISDSLDGESLQSDGCGNKTVKCGLYCEFCREYFSGRGMDCLDNLVQIICFKHFRDAMTLLNSSDWCVWSNVRSAYNNFTICTEQIAECLLIPWPNPLVEQTFLGIHSTFFHDCPNEELSDPPPSIVFALVMTPICLIPVMVVLVVLKTKNGDGRS